MPAHVAAMRDMIQPKLGVKSLSDVWDGLEGLYVKGFLDTVVEEDVIIGFKMTIPENPGELREKLFDHNPMNDYRYWKQEAEKARVYTREIEKFVYIDTKGQVVAIVPED